jgi:hypothetical protein
VNKLKYDLSVKANLSRYRHAGAKGDRSCSPYSFLTSALDRGERSASRPAALYPRYSLCSRLGGPQSRSEHRG